MLSCYQKLTGGEMLEKQKQTMFRLSETDHQNLKILAAKEKKSIQELILTALDKVFPNWRKNN